MEPKGGSLMDLYNFLQDLSTCLVTLYSDLITSEGTLK